MSHCHNKRTFLHLPYTRCMRQHLHQQTASDLSWLYTAVESTLSSCCPAHKTSCFHRSEIPPCFPKTLPVDNVMLIFQGFFIHLKWKITLYHKKFLFFLHDQNFYLFYLTCKLYHWFNRLTKFPVRFLKQFPLYHKNIIFLLTSFYPWSNMLKKFLLNFLKKYSFF